MDATEAYYFARSSGAGQAWGILMDWVIANGTATIDYMSDTYTDLNSQNRIMLQVMKAGTEGVPVDHTWVTACAGMKRVKEETASWSAQR